MNRALKGILIFLGIILFLFGGFYLFLHIAFDGIFTGPSYDKKDLIENYEARTDEILEVKNYYKSILPESASMTIEFDNDKELGIFHVKTEIVHQSNLSAILAGKRKISAALASKLGKFFGINPDVFLTKC